MLGLQGIFTKYYLQDITYICTNSNLIYFYQSKIGIVKNVFIVEEILVKVIIF